MSVIILLNTNEQINKFKLNWWINIIIEMKLESNVSGRRATFDTFRSAA